MSSRKISTRKREHIRSVKNGDFDKSAIAEHVHNTKHTIDFDGTKIIAKGTNFYDLAKPQNLINRGKPESKLAPCPPKNNKRTTT